MTFRTVVLTGSLLLAAGVACAETRVYDVDSKNADEIEDALRGVVGAQCNTPVLQGRCSVKLLPPGQIIIEAPPESHTQIAETLKAITARDVEATPRITLNYWVISGATGGGRATTPRGLEPVFAQLGRLHGDLAFSVVESASLTTESGTTANSNAGTLEVRNRVQANGTSLRAEIHLEYTKLPGPKCVEAACAPFHQELGLTVTIKRGEYLVLGERAFNGADGAGTMFYVVHWAEAE